MIVLPPHVHTYLSELASRLRALDGDLLGVYAGGSIGLDDYIPGRSDIDVAAVSRGAVSLGKKRAIVSGVRHESLPCPARRLELVVYAETIVGDPLAEHGFELELRTGARMPLHVAFDPTGANGRHRHLLNRSVLARRGVTLLGPQARTLVADIPRDLVLPALAETIRAHAARDAPDGEAVLSGCRALRYVTDGHWTSKADAGRWALAHLDDAEAIAEALRARQTGEPVDVSLATAFLERVADVAGGRTPDFGRSSGDVDGVTSSSP